MKILRKGSKFYSVSKNKCPKCHEASFWPNSPLRNLLFNRGKLNKKCSNCGLEFEIELGFWYGAMYISYALGVLLMLFIWLIHFIFFPFNNTTIIGRFKHTNIIFTISKRNSQKSII